MRTTGAAADRAALTADGQSASMVGGALLFAGIAPLRLVLFPGAPGVRMAVVTGGVAIFFALIRVAMLAPSFKAWIGRRGGLLFVACALEPLNVLEVSGEAWLTVGVVLMIVVTGALLHTRAQAALIIVSLLLVWTALALQHGFTAPWREAGVMLVMATVMAAVLNWVRVATADRLVETQTALHSVASTDGLTGLCNRRGLLTIGRAQLERARRSDHALSVVYVDVDGLKQVNDARGHAAGDALLQSTARALRVTTREGDVAARLGGDEFTLLLPGADEQQAGVVVDRIHAVLADIGVRASVGLATFDGAGDNRTLEELLSCADASMYAVKLARPHALPSLHAGEQTGRRPQSAEPMDPRAAAPVQPPLESPAELRALAAIGAGLFALLASLQPVLRTGSSVATMAGILGGTAVMFALLRLALGVKGLQPALESRPELVLALMVLQVSAVAVLAVHVVGSAEMTTAVVLAVLAAASLISSRRLASVVVALTVAGWSVIAVQHGMQSIWDDMAVNVGGTVAIAIILHVTQASSIRRLAVAEASIRTIAMTDELTGLLNRDGFLLAGRPMLATAVRSAAVLFVDANGLKRVNDTEGHDAGDRLIVTTGAVLRETLRSGDVIARLGGDEFAVLLPAADEVAVDGLVGRLHAHLAAANIEVSVGVARLRVDGETLEELLDQADAAMYRQKHDRTPRVGQRGNDQRVAEAGKSLSRQASTTVGRTA